MATLAPLFGEALSNIEPDPQTRLGKVKGRKVSLDAAQQELAGRPAGASERVLLGLPGLRGTCR